MELTVRWAQRCKKYFFGDYYPLTNQQRSPAAWSAYHLYLPAEQEGMILALRRAKSDIRAMTFELLTIDPAKDWKFEDYDSGNTWVVSGKAIREKGFEVVIPNRRDSRLLFYSVDRTGNVFAATGDKGVIYKITPDGKGAPFYKTRSTNVVSLAFDKDGNLLAGTESPGRVFRIIKRSSIDPEADVERWQLVSFKQQDS